jgi:hypothetical protein
VYYGTSLAVFFFIKGLKNTKNVKVAPLSVRAQKKWRLFILILTENKIEILMSKLIQKP